MIDKNGYDKSPSDVDEYRREYLKALPWLNIMSSPRPFHQVSEEEIESLRAEVERLRSEKEDRIRALEDRIKALDELGEKLVKKLVEKD